MEELEKFNSNKSSFFPNLKKYGSSLFALFILSAGLILTVFASSQKQDIRQRAENLNLKNNKFEIGVNVRNISFYGGCDTYLTLKECWEQTQNPLPRTTEADIGASLLELQNMGGSIIRTFVAYSELNHEENADKLDKFLTKAASYNISVIPTLIDFNASGYKNYPKGTGQYYNYKPQNWENFCCNLLNTDFFKNGYKTDYINFVKTIVEKNKNHSNIYAWEAGNELESTYQVIPESIDELVNFMNDTASVIKAIDPSHPISTGFATVSTIWIKDQKRSMDPSEIYPKLKDFDIITVHEYDGSRKALPEVEWALANGKKAFVEEIGFSGREDRSGKIKEELDFWKARGVSAVLQWGFQAKTLENPVFTETDGTKSPRVNDVSENVGMDGLPSTEIPYGHDFDYDKLFDLYKSYSQNTAPTPTPPTCLSVVTYAWNPTTGECKPYPNSCLPSGWERVKSCTLKIGLLGKYYHNISLSSAPSFQRIDPQIDFNWDVTPPSPTTKNNFSVRWTGQVLTTATSGNYIFAIRADDGARMWLNNQLIIDKWTHRDIPQDLLSSAVSLVANTKYPVKIEYLQQQKNLSPTINHVTRLRWKKPGTTVFETIPSTNFRTYPQ